MNRDVLQALFQPQIDKFTGSKGLVFYLYEKRDPATNMVSLSVERIPVDKQCITEQFANEVMSCGYDVINKDGLSIPRLKANIYNKTFGKKYGKLANTLIGRQTFRSLRGKHASWSGLGLPARLGEDKVPVKIS